jgi:hypothetical protein
MTGEREVLEPHSPFSDEVAAPQRAIQSGLKITIADILFCMFAVSIALAVQYQPWGEFKEVDARYVLTALAMALSASIFFTANRVRKAAEQPFFSMPPGFYLALLGASDLACDAFRYFVSFLDSHHVGDPIHVLADISPYLGGSVVSVLTVVRVNLAPRWQAVFVANAGSALLNGACAAAYYFASNSDMNDTFNVAYAYLWRLGFATWILTVVFVAVAYVADCVTRTKRDWWHHSVVILQFVAFILAFYETPELIQVLRYLSYWYMNL